MILTGTFAYFGFAGWDDMDRDPAEVRARLQSQLGEDYTPTTDQLARFQEFGRAWPVVVAPTPRAASGCTHWGGRWPSSTS